MVPGITAASFIPWQPQTDGTCKIVFDVTENPFTFAKLGIHYNRFTGIGIIANLTARNFFITNSRSLVTINIGKLSHSWRTPAIPWPPEKLCTDSWNPVRPVWSELIRSIQTGWIIQTNLCQSRWKVPVLPFPQFFNIGAGHRLEWVHYTPKISKGSIDLKGSNNYNTLYGYVAYNSLDRSIFTRKGVKLYAEAGRVLGQHPPDLDFLQDGEILSDSSADVSTHSLLAYYARCGKLYPYRQAHYLVAKTERAASTLNIPAMHWMNLPLAA